MNQCHDSPRLVPAADGDGPKNRRRASSTHRHSTVADSEHAVEFRLPTSGGGARGDGRIVLAQPAGSQREAHHVDTCLGGGRPGHQSWQWQTHYDLARVDPTPVRIELHAPREEQRHRGAWRRFGRLSFNQREPPLYPCRCRDGRVIEDLNVEAAPRSVLEPLPFPVHPCERNAVLFPFCCGYSMFRGQ